MIRFLKKRYVWAVLYGILLSAFTLYVVLDTFVLARVYMAVPEEAESGQSADPPLQSTDSGTRIGSYSDGRIEITVTEYRIHDTSVYVADILLSSADYLKTALAGNVYGRNVTDKTSSIAESHDAILAINGDYYGARQSGYCLDGGGSSTMYFNGEVIKQPTTNGRRIRERGVSDIVYTGY